MDNIVNQLAEQIALSSNSLVEETVQLAIKKHIANLDIKELVRQTVERVVKQNMEGMIYPDNSIPCSALNFKDFVITGSLISGGIQTNFGSTGIDDQATDCKLTIMDEYVVVENHMIAKQATIKGDLQVDGNLILKGDISTDSKGFKRIVDFATEQTKEAINDTMMELFASTTADKFKKDGIEAGKLTINGKSVLTEDGLGKSITKSNLQRVGLLQELQVKGETSLGETFYVGKNRVGVNTMEPSRALAVWEDECETVMGKYEKNTGYIGSARSQKVVLGSNGNVNIVLDVDGSTKITNLQLGSVRINSTDEIPGWTGKSGDIYFNESPKVGKPMGWVCLGGERWAQLPKITE